MPTLRFPLALAALTLALPAFAQSPTPPSQSPSTTPPAPSQSVAPAPSASAPSTGSFMTEMRAGLWRASKLNGVNVYNAQNEKIGDINDVLGMGEHDVAIPFDQVKFSDDPIRTASSSSSSSTSSSSSSNTANRNVDRSDVTGTTRTTSDNRRGYPDHAIVNMTKDQLKAAPQFKYSTSSINR